MFSWPVFHIDFEKSFQTRLEIQREYILSSLVLEVIKCLLMIWSSKVEPCPRRKQWALMLPLLGMHLLRVTSQPCPGLAGCKGTEIPVQELTQSGWCLPKTGLHQILSPSVCEWGPEVQWKTLSSRLWSCESTTSHNLELQNKNCSEGFGNALCESSYKFLVLYTYEHFLSMVLILTPVSSVVFKKRLRKNWNFWMHGLRLHNGKDNCCCFSGNILLSLCDSVKARAEILICCSESLLFYSFR